MTRRSVYYFSPRIMRAHGSDCWGREVDTALAAYSDDWLRALARTGFDAVFCGIDARLGLHIECQTYFVSPEILEQKLAALRAALAEQTHVSQTQIRG